MVTYPSQLVYVEIFGLSCDRKNARFKYVLYLYLNVYIYIYIQVHWLALCLTMINGHFRNRLIGGTYHA